MAMAQVLQTPWGCRWSRLSDPQPCAIKHSKTSQPLGVGARPTLHLSLTLSESRRLCRVSVALEGIEFGSNR